MVSPWYEPDRPLTLGIARAVVRSAFASVDAGSLAPLGSGWEFDTFVTTDGWVFRFPRRAEVEQLFEREQPVLDLVRSALPPSVAVPRVEVAEHRIPEFPYRIARHRLIRGVAADEVRAGLRASLARTIAEALWAVHSVPEPTARAAGVVELDREERGRIEWMERGSRGVFALSGSDPGLDRALTWLTRLEDPLRRLEAPLRLIHHDLSPEHLLADAGTGRLVGILDWTDAIIGDPARDFVPLVTFGGWGFADQVLARYPHAIDAGFRDRLRFMARLLPLMWLGHAQLRGDDITKHTLWVRNAFTENGGS